MTKLDILHAEALADHALWSTGHAGYQAAMDTLHAEALVENFLRQPHMARAMEIGAAERGRASRFQVGDVVMGFGLSGNCVMGTVYAVKEPGVALVVEDSTNARLTVRVKSVRAA